MLVKDFKSLFEFMSDDEEIRFTCGGELCHKNLTISTAGIPEFTNGTWLLEFVPTCSNCQANSPVNASDIEHKACCYCGRVFHDGDTYLKEGVRYFK